MFDLGLAGAFTQKLSPANRKEIQNILNRYVKSKDNPNGIIEQVQLAEGVKYFQITEMFLRTNSAMKTFIASNIIKQFKDKEFHKGRNSEFRLNFNYEAIKKLKSDYACARLAKGLVNCNQGYKKFRANIKNMGGDIAKGAQKSVDTISKANKKLAEAFIVMGKQL
ncbi:MAG: hypothetical protein GXP45_00675 [bacterium]|nr:hypothetical protein [bacterium]